MTSDLILLVSIWENILNLLNPAIKVKRQGFRLRVLRLGFSLQFTQYKQETANSLSALKP